MEVYIEYVIIDNLIINYLLLSLVVFTRKSNIKKTKLWFGSVVGTIFALICPLIQINSILLFMGKLMVGVIISLFISRLAIRDVLISYILFISYTFLMGGVCYFILIALDIPVTSSGVLIYSFDIPVSIIILIVYVYYLIVRRLVRYRRNILNYMYEVTIYKGDKTMELCGFLDTGNQIYDEYGMPVVVISLNSFLRIYPEISLLRVATNNVNNSDISDSKYLTISTANSTSKILVFRVDKLKVLVDKDTKEYKDVTVGVSNSDFNQNFDCILHSEYV